MQTSTITYIIPTVVHIYYDSIGVANLPSFQQIDSMIAAVNVYLRKDNADTSIIASDFRNIIGDAQIELRLARYDTSGNCISGIFYHNVDNHAIQPVQHYQDYQHYFNVHINVPPAQNAGAYATLPTTWNTPQGIGNDGIFFVQEGAFTPAIFLHEIGHWLGLLHVWGNPPPYTSCVGTDFVADTPPTMGTQTCDTTQNICTPGIRENVQNFMDYSSCPHMFTDGQVVRMHGILNDQLLSRKEICINSNLISTGVLTPPTCVDSAQLVIVEFPNFQLGCSIVGTRYFICSPITAIPDSVHWTFQNGIPATSNSGVQLVSFSVPGNKNISMTAYYNGIPHTENRVYRVDPPDSLTTANGLFYNINYPFTENFENGFFFPDGHVRIEAADTTWELKSGVGYNSDSCLYVRRENNVGVDTNKIVLGTFNLDTITNPVLRFYVSASDYANAIDRKIMVRGRQWCNNGRTYWLDVIYDSMMTGTNTGTNFIPSSPAQWYRATVNLGAMNVYGNMESEISIMLVKDFSQGTTDNNFYLDNISIFDSVVGLPPVAAFSMTDSVVCTGACNYMEFVDRSTNLPDHYYWNLTSNPLLQNAVLLGTFCFIQDSVLATLIVSNEYGADTVSHWIYTRNFNNLTATADTTVICAGDTVTLSAHNFDSDVTFLWENMSSVNPAATLLSQTDSTVQAIPVQQSTQYKLTVWNSTGCTSIRSVTIIRNIYPGASFTSTASCVGAGSSVALNGMNCPSCTITWANSPALDTLAGQFVVADSLTTSTAFTVSYTLNGCTSMFMDTINVSNPYPTGNISADDTLLCPGQQVHFNAQGTSGLSNYMWTGPPCCIIPFNPMGDSATSTPNGSYWFTLNATDSNGCVTPTDSLYVQTISTPTFWIHPYNNYFGGTMIRMCLFVDSVALYAQGPPNTNYAWSVNNGFLTQVDDTTVVYHNSAMGVSQLTVTATNNAGCTSTQVRSIDKNMSYNEPVFTAAPLTSTICEGDSVFVNITPGNFYYYNYWENHQDDVNSQFQLAPAIGSMGNGDNAWLSPDTTTGFLLTVFDWYTGCAATRTIMVNVNPAPPVIANTTDTFLCLGQQVTLTGSGAQTYSWSNSVVNGFPFTPGATQTYTVIGTDAIGCSATDTVTVTVDVCTVLGEVTSQSVTVYPVPATSVLNVSNPNGLELNLSLTDVNGREVNSISGNSTILQLNTSELADGLYFLKLSGGEEQVFKVVIKRQ